MKITENIIVVTDSKTYENCSGFKFFYEKGIANKLCFSYNKGKDELIFVTIFSMESFILQMAFKTIYNWEKSVMYRSVLDSKVFKQLMSAIEEIWRKKMLMFSLRSFMSMFV